MGSLDGLDGLVGLEGLGDGLAGLGTHVVALEAAKKGAIMGGSKVLSHYPPL